MLDKMSWEVSKVWQVKTVQSDHGPRAILAVVVPIPRRGEDDVCSLHLDALTTDCRETSLALNDESHGKYRVAVSLGRLVGHDELQHGIHRVCGEGGIFGTSLASAPHLQGFTPVKTHPLTDSQAWVLAAQPAAL